MSFSVRFLPAVLAVILSLPASLCAQSTVKEINKTVRASVSGRVTIKEKGAAGVMVILRKSEAMMPFEPFQRATTDQDGYYRIANVSPGSYDVSPSTPAFVMANAKEQKRKSVLVGEDEAVENINFALVRGGVITGRVTDADGRPLIQQQVAIYLAEAFDQITPQRPAFAVSNAQTDDRGIYRAFGLVPGRYKVACGRGDNAFGGSLSQQRSTYKQVFYPDANDQAKAKIIEVSEGSEAAGIDIALGRALQTFSASGRVLDAESGMPMPNARFGLQRTVGQRFEFVNTLTTANSQGDFVAEGLIPGKYGAFMLEDMSSGGMRVEPMTFDIVDQDVTGLTVKLIKGANVTGVVVLENEDRVKLSSYKNIYLSGYVADPTATVGMQSTSTSPVAPDGTFKFSGLPRGTLNFNLNVLNSPYPPKGLSIARVERDGVLMPRNVVEIKEGEQVSGVRVILTYGSANLKGVVKLENGVLPEGTRIFLRLSKLGDNLTPFRPPQPDARGYFLIEGLPAGNYEIVASIVSVTATSVSPPRRVIKKEVAVQDGGTIEITLTIDMSESPKP